MNSSQSPLVETSQGRVQGCYAGGIVVFKGLPYAAPPRGARRWLPPASPEAWSGIRPAVEFAPSAPQNPTGASRFKQFVVEGPQDEDCLYLNIWTPAADHSRRPVMVWIHGGVFTMGSGSQSVFNGAHLAASRDVVVVTLNYRLGLLGFLNLAEITGGQIPAHGNTGLLDQVAALRWLRSNIAAFGGDPANITLFGESAGGASIACLMVMPQARGLFQKAILQSNIHRFITLPEAVETARRVLQELKITPAQWSDLQTIPVERLLAVQKKLNAGKPEQRVELGPVIDGDILPAAPLEAFRTGTDSEIPVIIGTNREEARLFPALRPGRPITAQQLEKELHRLLPDTDPQVVIREYRDQPAAQGAPDDPDRLLAAVQTELNFRRPAELMLQARCPHHPQTFAYRFNRQSPALGGILGACHGMEIGFIFGNYDDSFEGSGPAAAALSRRISTAWADFARTGNPSGAGLDDWPPYCPQQYVKMID